jgi:hypothetical protein
MNTISLTLLLADCMVAVLNELSCGKLSSLRFAVLKMHMLLVRHCRCCLSCRFGMLHDAHVILHPGFFILQLAPMIATCLNFCFVLGWEPCNLWFLTQPLSVNFSLLALALM